MLDIPTTCGEIYADLENGGLPRSCMLPRGHAQQGIQHGGMMPEQNKRQQALEQHFDSFMTSIMTDIGLDRDGNPLSNQPPDVSHLPSVPMIGG